MAVEGENVVEEIQLGADGKPPEMIPWSKYVGIKEAWGKAKTRLAEADGKVLSLEEQLKKVTSTGEVDKLKKDLADVNAKLQTTTKELTDFKDKSLSGKRDTLTKRGVPEAKVKELSDKELDAAFIVLEHVKPGADLGGGGGANPLRGSPMELAQLAYAKPK